MSLSVITPLRVAVADRGRGLAACARLAACRRGVTAIEYALMGSLVAVAISAALFGYTGNLGSAMTHTFTQIAASM